MMKISVVIPIFNKESYLDQCLTSLQNQTYKNIEIVCVDDGSADSSLQVLERYAKEDHRIKIVNQENSGTLMARKVGVEHSTGDYIMFLDPDDWYENTTCEDMLACIMETNADVVMAGYVFEGDIDTRNIDLNYFDFYFNGCLRTCHTLTNKKDILRKAFISCEIPAPQSGKIFKSCVVKEAFKLIPPIRCVFAEDQGTAFFIFNKSNKIVFLNKKLYHYSLGVGISTQTKYSLQRFVDCLQSFDMLKAIKRYVETQTEDGDFLKQIEDAIQRRMVETILLFTTRMKEDVVQDDWQSALLNKCGLDMLIHEIISRSNNPENNKSLTFMIKKNRKHLKQVRVLLILCAFLFVFSGILLFVLLNR